MTSFSLFHKPSFDTKLRKIPRTAEIAALTASMFAFSARFVQDSAARSESSHGQEVIHCPTTDRFYRLASHYLEEAMDTEEVPSLCVLQALILTTFYQLSQDVRGRAWRSLGTCVRVAYEMELHLIDTKSFHFRNETVDVDNTRWIHDEERRRAWWALWELDIYASTIRRLPTGHDCTQIETLLPVGDEAWFSGVYQASCPLDPGPNSRWKVLKTSGNRGWKAWFIVIISMMRDAHLLSYSRVTHGILTSHGTTQAHGSAPVGWTRCRSEDSIMDGLKELGNSLTSLSMAIPPSLAYHNEYLSFQPERFPGGQSTLDADCAKYSIFLMTQLTKFMIHHYEMFWAARVADKMAGESEHLSVELRFGEGSFARTAINTKAWEQYLEAADNILHIIRSSSPYHIRYVNPHFSSTIWLAAVAQVVRKVFNPGPRESQVTQSKLDVLQYNFNSYVSFWNVSHALQHKLNTLEGRLETLQRFHDTNAKSASGSVHGVQDKGSETVHANSHAADNATQGQGSRTNLLQTTAAEDIVSSSETLYANTPNFLDGFHSCGPFGLSADMVNSSWALTTVDMEYNPSDYFNYDVKDFLNYSFDG
jgi:hypothetical protein